MTTYTATFSNGLTFSILNSKRTYGFAYFWTGIQDDGTPREGHGFARTRQLAEKAMSSENTWLRNPPVVRKGPLSYVQAMRKRRAEWKPGQITFSEVVEVGRVPNAGTDGPALLTEILNGKR